MTIAGVFVDELGRQFSLFSLGERSILIVRKATFPKAIEDVQNLAALGAFCRQMGRETNQGEIGLVIGDEYFAIQDFDQKG